MDSRISINVFETRQINMLIIDQFQFLSVSSQIQCVLLGELVFKVHQSAYSAYFLYLVQMWSCLSLYAGVSGRCWSKRSHTSAQSGPSQPGLVWPGRPRWSYSFTNLYKTSLILLSLSILRINCKVLLSICVQQIVDFLNVADEPVLGYAPPTSVTTLHLHLWSCSLDYR